MYEEDTAHDSGLTLKRYAIQNPLTMINTEEIHLHYMACQTLADIFISLDIP